MKKAAFLIAALMMALTVLPAAHAEGTRNAVTYTGETVYAESLTVGGTFDWTLSVSAGSGLFSGRWLIDYPEEFVEPVSASTTFPGSLTNILAGSGTSDTASFPYSLDYVGQTGSSPCGEAGNHYTSVGMFLTSFDHWGVQEAGPFIRVTFRLTAEPTLQTDYYGDFFTIPIVVVESNYFVVGSTVAPGNDYAHPHETVNVIIGKVYVGTQPTPDTCTVRFYGYNNELLSTQYVPYGGAAEAPDTPDVVDSLGQHRFYAWDRPFDHVTQSMSVYAEYLLLGDVDENGRVEIADALLTLRGAMGLIPLNARQTAAADIDGSGIVNITDALSVLRYAMGLVTVF